MDGNASSLHCVERAEEAQRENDDVSERNHIEAQLAFQAQLLSTVHDAIIAVDENMCITFWNGMAEDISGWAEEEATELSGKEMSRRLGVDSFWPVFTAQLDAAGAFAGEIEATRKDGSPVIVDLHMKRIYGPSGNFRGTISTFRDITERKKMDEALRASEEMLRTVLDMSLIGICRFNYKAGRFDYLSPSATSILGYSVEELLYMDKAAMHATIHPDDVPGMLAEIERLEKTGEATAEYRQKHKNGTYIWMANHMSIVRDDKGSPAYRYGNLRNVTESKRAEEALRFQANILGIMDDAVIAFDPGQHITYWSPGARKMYGWTAEEALRKTPAEILRPLQYETETLQDMEERQAAFKRGELVQGENVQRRKDGSEFWVEYHSQAFFDSNGALAGFITIQRDVTERKRDEEALRESEKRQEYLLKLSDALRPLSDANAVKDAAARLLADHLGASQSNYSDYQEEYSMVSRENLNDAAISVVGSHKLSDFPATMEILNSGRDMIIPDIAIFPPFSNDERAQYLSRNIHANATVPIVKDGKLVATLTIRQTTPRDWKPEEVRLIRETAERTWSAVMRAKAENALRESEEQARMLAEALEKKNQLVTDFFINISHEFKTPLTILMLGLELLEVKAKKMKGGDAFIGNLTAMKQNSYRLNRLVANLLDITKLDAGFMQPKWEEADIAALLRNLAQSVEPYARQRHLTLKYECDPEAIPFTTDGFMVERIALNLLSNAIKHTPAGGKISISCHAGGEGISITVADSGEGIPKDKQAALFNRFTQVDTRMTRASEGTGIGLALTKSLVELMDGKISVESAPGAGSTFTAELPYMRKAAANGVAERGNMQIDKRVLMELSDIIAN